MQAYTASIDGAPDFFTRTIISRIHVEIRDPQLDRLCRAWLLPGIPLNCPENLLQALDAYTQSNYGAVVRIVSALPISKLRVEHVGLSLRAAAIANWERPTFAALSSQDSLLGRLIDDLDAVIRFRDDAGEAKLRLTRQCLTHCSCFWASSLWLILERQENNDRAFEPTNSQQLAVLRAELDQPIFAFCYLHQSARQDFLGAFKTLYPNSTTIQTLTLLEGEKITLTNPLDANRMERLNAFARIRKGDLQGAIATLRQQGRNGQQLVQHEAAMTVIKCLLHTGDIASCSEVATNLLVQSRYFGSIIPIRDIVCGIMLNHNTPMPGNPTRGLISVAIIFDFYSRFVSSDRDAERADAYKDVLRRNQVSRASELLNSRDNLNLEHLIYFLRFICVPNLLDQSLELDSTRAVEDERARILVYLSELVQDEAKKELKEELREIRTRQVVRDTTLRLDKSKIYVNIEGLKRTFDVTMRDNWNRFRLMELQGQPSSEVQNIERIIRTASGDQVFVISLRGPVFEKAQLFQTMLDELRDGFAFSKEYGLDSNLSTNIRHGYVLRELRGPLVARNLITNKDSESGSYHENEHWVSRAPEFRDALNDFFGEFSQAIDEQIDRLNRRLLRIHSDNNPEGLFRYAFNQSLVISLQLSSSQIAIYEEFVDHIIAFLWLITEDNLARVREFLLSTIHLAFNEILTKLEDCLRASSLEHFVPGLFTAITMVRPEIRSAIERVASWFTISGNSEYQDYNLEIAYQAALSTVKTYYTDLDISSSYNSKDGDILLAGRTLPIFARVFFTLLDNAAYHGAHGQETLALEVSTKLEDGFLYLDVGNKLSPSLDLTGLQAKAQRINSEYGREGASARAVEEGGSGYAKIWKLLKFDLATSHDLKVEVAGQKFLIDLVIDVRGLIACAS